MMTLCKPDPDESDQLADFAEKVGHGIWGSPHGRETPYDFVPIGICLIADDYSVRVWNRCLEGWSRIGRGEILGRSILEVFPRLSDPAFKNRIALMFRGSAPTVFSSLLHKHFFPFQISQGECQRHSATLMSVPTGKNGCFGALIAIEDQTHLVQRIHSYREMKNQAVDEAKKRLLAEETIKKHAAELEILNAAKDKYFSIIAHDLRGPIGYLQQMLEFLAEEHQVLSKEEILEAMQDMKKTVDASYSLLENLLTWSRSQGGKMNFLPERHDLSVLVCDVTQTFHQYAQFKHLTITARIPEGISATVDAHMFSTIMRNLLSNAIKFSREKGTVTIQAKELPDAIQFSVKDNGIGMSREVAEKIFRIDFDVRRLHPSERRGTGLGLILCKEFAECHGGKIWFETEKGRGSTFHFLIPNSHTPLDLPHGHNP